MVEQFKRACLSNNHPLPPGHIINRVRMILSMLQLHKRQAEHTRRVMFLIKTPRTRPRALETRRFRAFVFTFARNSVEAISRLLFRRMGSR